MVAGRPCCWSSGKERVRVTQLRSLRPPGALFGTARPSPWGAHLGVLVGACEGRAGHSPDLGGAPNSELGESGHLGQELVLLHSCRTTGQSCSFPVPPRPHQGCQALPVWSYPPVKEKIEPLLSSICFLMKWEECWA